MVELHRKGSASQAGTEGLFMKSNPLQDDMNLELCALLGINLAMEDDRERREHKERTKEQEETWDDQEKIVEGQREVTYEQGVAMAEEQYEEVFSVTTQGNIDTTDIFNNSAEVEILKKNLRTGREKKAVTIGLAAKELFHTKVIKESLAMSKKFNKNIYCQNST